MQYFLETVDTIIPGVGFEHYSPLHLTWLGIFLVVAVVCSILYRKSNEKQRDIWRKTVSALIVADEIFKMVMLTVGGTYTIEYLPLHLCSINIFLIAIHAWYKPYTTLSAFMYTVCIPGALAALLFPSWSSLPLANFMHLHSFTVHILLALYPIMLTAGGDIRPVPFDILKCMGLLLCMAVPVYLFNLAFGSNYMFLMYAEPGNPLYLFEEAFGSHLIGFPVIIAGVVLVMHLPPYLMRKNAQSK